MTSKRVVILGGGFGGIAAARALRRSGAEVLLIDRRNHHIFQPLLYQVAFCVLAVEVAPIRQLAQHQPNLSVLMAEVTDVDLAAQQVHVSPPGLPDRKLSFDYLIHRDGVRPNFARTANLPRMRQASRLSRMPRASAHES